MSGQKLKHAMLGAAAAGALLVGLAGQANAVPVILDGWNFNLSVANGQFFSGGGAAISGLGNATVVDHLDYAGRSSVTQHFVAGSANGQTFTESGFLDITDYVKETSVTPISILFPLTGNSGNTFGAGSTFSNAGYHVYLDFTGLRGIASTVCPGGAAGCITFTPGMGEVLRLILDESDTDPTTRSLVLATYTIIPPSGGTFPAFFGGAGPNGTVDITMLESPAFAPAGPAAGLFTDSAGNNLASPPTLHLLNMHALCVAPCAAPTGALLGEDVVFSIDNNGNYNLAVNVVPEPATLSLLGAGLALMGFGKRRRKSRS